MASTSGNDCGKATDQGKLQLNISADTGHLNPHSMMPSNSSGIVCGPEMAHIFNSSNNPDMCTDTRTVMNNNMSISNGLSTKAMINNNSQPLNFYNMTHRDGHDTNTAAYHDTIGQTVINRNNTSMTSHPRLQSTLYNMTNRLPINNTDAMPSAINGNVEYDRYDYNLPGHSTSSPPLNSGDMRGNMTYDTMSSNSQATNISPTNPPLLSSTMNGLSSTNLLSNNNMVRNGYNYIVANGTLISMAYGILPDHSTNPSTHGIMPNHSTNLALHEISPNHSTNLALHGISPNHSTNLALHGISPNHNTNLALHGITPNHSTNLALHGISPNHSTNLALHGILPNHSINSAVHGIFLNQSINSAVDGISPNNSTNTTVHGISLTHSTNSAAQGISPNSSTGSADSGGVSPPHSPISPVYGMSTNYYSDSSFHSTMHELEKAKHIRALINEFPVLQVYGAPLVGKSTLVCQALDDMFEPKPEGKKKKVIHINCKKISTLTSIIEHLTTQLQIQSTPNSFSAARHITDALQTSWTDHLVLFVFHKCETLKEIDHFEFIKFLCGLNRASNDNIKSVFTTYKRFMCHAPVGETFIEMMDNSDIRNCLRFYLKSDVDIEGYIQMIIRNNLCFPLGLRRIVEIYLQDSKNRLKPDVVEMQVQKSLLSLFSELLEDRVLEVESWVPVSHCQWIALFCSSDDVSSSEELLKELTDSEDDYGREWNLLEKAFAVRRVPGLNRLQFHPLLVHYFKLMMKQRTLALEGMWFEISSSKVVKFLCQVLCVTEEMSQHVGHKSAVIQCVVQEWPLMKNTIKWAIHCNNNTYVDLCKVAMMGAHMLIKWFPVESVQFFQSLYDHANQKHYFREAAVLQGLMAHAVHLGNGSTQKGQNWESTDGHFKSALKILERDGASFYLAQLLCLYARALNYQGNFSLSLHYVERGTAMMKQRFGEEKEDHMSVTKGRIKDLEQRMDLGRALPLVFTGRNDEAKAILLKNLTEMRETGIDHSTLPSLLNLLGLTSQRGKRNLEEALSYYSASLNERMGLEKFCPLDLVVPYNNIAGVLVELGHLERGRHMLEKALDIQRKHKQKNYYTALTLVHHSEVCMQSNDLCESFEDAKKAQNILDETCNKHDLRLHLQMLLAHLRLALEQGKENALAFSDGIYRTGSPFSASCCQPDFVKLLSTISKSKTAEIYFENIFQLGEKDKTNLSDKSHHFLLSALEHLILLSWGNRESMQFHIDRMGYVFATYQWLVKEFEKPKKLISPKMSNHYEFYVKVQEILSKVNHDMSSQFDFSLQHLLKTCTLCEMSSKYFDKSAWTTRICHSCKLHQRTQCQSIGLNIIPVCSNGPNSILHVPDSPLNHRPFQVELPATVLELQRRISQETEQSSSVIESITDENCLFVSENQPPRQTPIQETNASNTSDSNWLDLEGLENLLKQVWKPNNETGKELDIETSSVIESITAKNCLFVSENQSLRWPPIQQEMNALNTSVLPEMNPIHTYSTNSSESDSSCKNASMDKVPCNPEDSLRLPSHVDSTAQELSANKKSVSVLKCESDNESKEGCKDSNLLELLKQAWKPNNETGKDLDIETRMSGMGELTSSLVSEYSLSSTSKRKPSSEEAYYDRKQQECNSEVRNLAIENKDPSVMHELFGYDDGQRRLLQNSFPPDIESGYNTQSSIGSRHNMRNELNTQSLNLGACNNSMVTKRDFDMRSYSPRQSSDMGTFSPPQSSDMGTHSPRQISDVRTFSPRQSSDMGTYSPQQSPDMGTYSPRQSSDIGSYSPRQSSDLGTHIPRQISDVRTFSPRQSSDMGTYSPLQSPDMGTHSPHQSFDLGTCSPRQSSDMGTHIPCQISDVRTFSPHQISDVGTYSLRQSFDIGTYSPRQRFDLGTCSPHQSSGMGISPMANVSFNNDECQHTYINRVPENTFEGQSDQPVKVCGETMNVVRNDKKDPQEEDEREVD